MREIVEDVLTWPWFSEPHGYDFNGHLLRHPDGNICVDPVQPSDDDLAVLGDEGVTRILLTNRNHTRACNWVKAATGATVAIHAADARHARDQEALIDADLALGSRIGPLEVVDAAGKSPGEVALYWRERGILIVGDAVIGNPPGQCGLLPERVMDDPARLRTSLRGLLQLEFDTLLFGDGVSILTGARARLEALVATFDD